VVGATIPGFGLAAQCGNIADPAFLQAFASAHTSAIQPDMACYKCLDWLPIHAVMVLGAVQAVLVSPPPRLEACCALTVYQLIHCKVLKIWEGG